jgi:hypothetical protein
MGDAVLWLLQRLQRCGAIVFLLSWVLFAVAMTPLMDETWGIGVGISLAGICVSWGLLSIDMRGWSTRSRSGRAIRSRSVRRPNPKWRKEIYEILKRSDS